MPNIAVVVLDTLRKDYFDDYFDWLPGTRFEHAWTTAQYTIPAHASLLSGRYPTESGVHSKSEMLTCDTQLVTERLSEAGYTTRAITSNLLMSPLFRFDRGIDQFYFSGRARTLSDSIYPWQERVESSLRRGLLRDIRLVADCVLSNYDTLRSLSFGLRLKKGQFLGIEDTIDTVSQLDFGTDEFLLINTMEAHAPYEPPEAYRTTDYEEQYIESRIRVDDPETLADERTAYEDSVRYLSDRYQVLFEELTEDFDVIITLSDHGELFGEHGTSRHYYGVPPELTHIPLSIYVADDSDGNERIDHPASLLDVHKTLLKLAGLEAPSRGHDLLGDGHGDEYIVESLGVRTPLFERLQDAGFDDAFLHAIDQPLRGIALPERYYGFETPDGDFVESGDAIDTDPRQRLGDIVASLDAPTGTPAATNHELSAGISTQLEDLGYL